MKKFIVIYHATENAMKQTENTSPEDRKKSMEAWHHWAQKCGDKLNDMGNPLANGMQLNTEGQFKSSTHNVVGYSMLQADSLNDAKNLLLEHPHLGWNSECSIEVHEVLPLPDAM